MPNGPYSHKGGYLASPAATVNGDLAEFLYLDVTPSRYFDDEVDQDAVLMAGQQRWLLWVRDERNQPDFRYLSADNARPLALAMQFYLEADGGYARIDRKIEKLEAEIRYLTAAIEAEKARNRARGRESYSRSVGRKGDKLARLRVKYEKARRKR